MLDPRETLAGVVGSVGCVYAGLPFEVIKVRMQTQDAAKRMYRNLVQTGARIAREEGVTALWKGAVPALSSAIVENAVLFSVNGMVRRSVLALSASRRELADNKGGQLSMVDEALIGGASGIFSATAITPFEMIKCRLQYQRGHIGNGTYRGPVDCARKVVQAEGFTGLFRGLSALLMRDVPFNCFFFGAYEVYTAGLARMLDRPTKNELHPLLILMSGGLAGATSWSIIFPADVLKSYLQTSAAETVQEGSGTRRRLLSGRLVKTAKFVYTQHGIRGFYRGWSAGVLRSIPANGALFFGVEMTHRCFRYFSNLQSPVVEPVDIDAAIE